MQLKTVIDNSSDNMYHIVFKVNIDSQYLWDPVRSMVKDNIVYDSDNNI